MRYREIITVFSEIHTKHIQFTVPAERRIFKNLRKTAKSDYSKTCLKRNAIVPLFFPHFHRFPFYKGLCFNKTKYKKYDRLGLQWRDNLK